MKREVLRLDHIGKSMDGERLLLDVNLSVYHSAFHCLLIPNQGHRACLVDILRGVLVNDSGYIYVNDKPVTAAELHKRGVRCIYRKSSLVSQMSVAENIFLTDKLYFQYGLIRLKLMTEMTKQLLSESGMQDIGALQAAGRLNNYTAHMVEIISAISKGAQILCLDNITEQYTDAEIAKMWRFIKYLNGVGIAVILIAPKYNTLYGYAHYTTIIDNGSTVITLPAPQNNREQLLRYLKVSDVSVIEKHNASAKQILRFISRTQHGKGIDISVRSGEIVGVYDEDKSIADCLIGAFTGNVPHGTKFLVNELPTTIDSLQAAIKHGFVLIHEGSVQNQIFPNMSLIRNITVNMGAPLYNRLGIRSRAVEKYITRHTLQTLECDYLLDRYGGSGILPPLPWHEQMKIIVARWLCRKPQVFVFINPLLNYNDVTVHEFYTLVNILKEQGYGVLLVSSSLNELRRITENYGKPS